MRARLATALLLFGGLAPCALSVNATNQSAPPPLTTTQPPFGTPALTVAPAAGQGPSSPVKGSAARLDARTRLYNDLLEGYAPTIPPAGVVVQSQMFLEQLVEVDTPRQTFTIQYWSRAYWNDPRLSWNATEWGIDTITFGPGEVWQPDEYIYETQELISQVPAIQVSSDGAVFRSAHRVSTLGCKMQLTRDSFRRIDTYACQQHGPYLPLSYPCLKPRQAEVRVMRGHSTDSQREQPQDSAHQVPPLLWQTAPVITHLASWPGLLQ